MKVYTPEAFRNFLRGLYGEDWAGPVAKINGWLARGDSIAVYRNEDLGHPDMGSVKVVSFGSANAYLETETPPDRLPDTPQAINWRYVLHGTYRGEQVSTNLKGEQ